MKITLTEEQYDKFREGEGITLYAPATEATVTHVANCMSFHRGPRDAFPLMTVSIPCHVAIVEVKV
jgi:hypothetical protein